MTKIVMYEYLGTNGTILSPVHLEDIYYIRKLRLIADVNKRLTKNDKDYCSYSRRRIRLVERGLIGQFQLSNI